MARRSLVGPAPVARTATTVATAAVVAHGVNRRVARRDVRLADDRGRGVPYTPDARKET
jgi:hypothetical protein